MNVKPANTATAPLALKLLGPLVASVGNQTLTLPKSRKARALLALVATSAKGVPKEQLCRLLFESSEDPRGSLRWALSRLRSALGTNGGDYIISEGRVRISPWVQTDVDQLATVSNDLENRTAQELIALGQQIDGGFLDNLELDDCPEFEAWRLAERARWQAKHAAILRRIIELSTGKPAAVDHARRLVAIQPDSETAWAALVSELRLSGDLKQARRIYAVAHRELEKEGVPLTGLLRDAITFRDLPLAVTESRGTHGSMEIGLKPVLRINPTGVSPASDRVDAAAVAMALFIAASRSKSCTTLAPMESSSLSLSEPLQVDLILDSRLERVAGNLLLQVNLVRAQGGASLYGWELPLTEASSLSEQITAYFSCHLEVDLTLALINHALEKPDSRRTARDHYHLALPKIYTAEGYEPSAALQSLELVIEKAPALGPALCALSWVRNTIVEFNSDPSEIRVTSSLARRAVEHCQDDAFVLGWAAVVIAHADLDLRTAEDLVNRALSLNPHSPMALIGGSFVAHYAGDYELSMAYVQRAEAYGTAGPLAFLCFTCRAMSSFQLGQYAEAMEMAERATGHNPTFIVPLRYRAASLAQLGQMKEANRVAEQMVQLDPSERLAFFRQRSPYASTEALDRLCEALRLAGLPA